MNKKGRNDFTYLKELIEREDEIILNRDIILDSKETDLFSDGIEIAKDNIVINGCNHVIDAKGKASIFNISSKEITLKNITFKNGYNLEKAGAINHNQGSLNIIGCKFINNSSGNTGGAILSSHRSKISIKNTEFLKNNALKGGCIFNKNGKIDIMDSGFMENSAEIDASTIISMMMASITIDNCIFKNNHSQNAGTLLNFGRCNISKTIFQKNTVEEDGGAINNQTMNLFRGRLTIRESEFIENEAGNNGGAIINFSDIKLDNTLFSGNRTKNQAGAISNGKTGSISAINCRFIQNNAKMTSGAIINWGKIDIDSIEFKENRAKEFGGAILNGETGYLKINRAKFRDNSSDYSGGAIVNWSKIYLNDTLFENNSAELGGAVNCAKKAHTKIENSRFVKNSSRDGGAIFNNSHDTKISESLFRNHTTDNVIHNYKTITIINSDFKDNESDNIIINDEYGLLSVNGGIFNNIANKSTICNTGKLTSIFQTKFESGKEIIEIYNETYMVINDLKFKSKERTVINRGILDVKNIRDRMIDENIDNRNTINNFSKRTSNRYDFTNLQNKINKKAKFKRPNLKLKEDISLEFYESDYFEGGMEIRADNLTIDGDNHTIDAKNRTRIFIVNAQNVRLKNITLKNGAYRNDFDDYVLGGGAIHVLRNSSITLENIRFIENSSNTCGGAVLNEGTVKSINSKFIHNTSNSYGGAIYNKNRFNTDNDEFKDNCAKIAGAIYNQNCLSIDNDIYLDNNKSQFEEEIYNSNVINVKSEFMDSIYNTYRINEKESEQMEGRKSSGKKKIDYKEREKESEYPKREKESEYPKREKSFKHLADKLEDSDFIKLDENIIFDYKKDHDLRYLIEITKDVTIDGNFHTIEFDSAEEKTLSIDGNRSSPLFKIIKESTNVILKNIVFKNCYTKEQSIIENKGNLTIENCRFINNHISENNSLIDNKSKLKISNTNFANNRTNKESMIKNSSRIEITNSNFINNKSQAIGTCITNSDEMTIEKTIFKSNTTKNKAGAIHNEYKANLKLSNVDFEYNSAEVDGGTIYNYGKLDIEDSTFTRNSSQDDGGVINNRTSGKIKIRKSEFIKNKSKSNGGVIYNYGTVDIDSCEFKGNSARYRASVIENAKALDAIESHNLKISNTQFIENNSKDNEEVFTFDESTLELINCNFTK